MGTFINGTAAISPQRTFENKFFGDTLQPLKSNRLACIEPDYSSLIDAKQIRRMSRIIKMGIAGSVKAMKDSGLMKPDAIIVGTALGCLEDTSSFLKKMIEYQEEMMNPTAFIQSTHNTIASQIALFFQCKGYNSTYVHPDYSLESSLLDGMLLLNEKTCENVLAGGVDEIIDPSFKILERLGNYKKSSEIALAGLYNSKSSGSIAGEGSFFFLLGSVRGNNCYAQIKHLETISSAAAPDVIERIFSLLNFNGINKPDLVISGHNGDFQNDNFFDEVLEKAELGDRVIKFKHYSGEFPTSNGFAIWMGASILKAGQLPGSYNTMLSRTPENILIYNQNRGKHHSLVLLSKVLT